MKIPDTNMQDLTKIHTYSKSVSSLKLNHTQIHIINV